MAAHGGVVGQTVGFGDFGSGAPAEEVGLDGFAVRVLANAALTRVALGIGRRIVWILPWPTSAVRSNGAGGGVGLQEGLGGLEGLGWHVGVSFRGP